MTEEETYQRQVAIRALATELLDATFTFKESDEERAPVYNVLPTGERANRVFIVGTATETEDVGSDSEYYQLKIVDPAGDAYYCYAGQYQPEAASTIRALETPAYVAVTAKVDTYETDEDEVRVSLTPESVTEVDQETRDEWVVETVAATLERIEAMDEEKSTMEQQLAAEHYGGSVSEYLDAATEALATVEGADVEMDGESASGGEAASAD
jgi:RPA family protein